MRWKSTLFFVSFCFLTTAGAQRPPAFQWRLAPQLDSFDRSYEDSNIFKIYRAGKVGLYGVNYGQMVPAVYDEIGMAVNATEFGWDYWLTPVKRWGKWGLYAWQLTDDLGLDTQEMLPCAFDEIRVHSDTENYILEAEVKQGKKRGTFNALTHVWRIPLAEPQPKTGKAKTGKYPYPPVATQQFVVPEIIEELPDVSDMQYPRNIGTKDNGFEYTTAKSEGPREYGAQSPYPKEDSNALVVYTIHGDRAQFQIVVRRGYRRKWGVLLRKTKEVLIAPDFSAVEYNGGFFYCSKPEHGDFIQVFDTLGKPITPWIQWRNGINKYTHRVAFDEQKQFGIYDMQWHLISPMAYQHAQFSRQERYIALNKKGKWFLFDVEQASMLNDSFDSIHSDVELPYFLVTIVGKCFLYHTATNTKSVINKTRFIRSHDSFGIIQKRKKQALVNLNTGQVKEFLYDSILFIPDFTNFRRWQNLPKNCQTNRIFLVYKKGQIGLADENGKLAVANSFDRAAYPNPMLIALGAGNYNTFYSLCKNKVVLDSAVFANYLAYRIPPNFVNEDYNRNRIGNYLVIFKRNGNIGVLMEPDSLVLPPAFDSVIMVANHTIFKHKMGYYVLNTNRLPFNTSDLCDSFRLLENEDLVLHRGNKTSLLNSNGDLEVAASDLPMNPLYTNGSSTMYSYFYQGKFGVVVTHNFNSGNVFDGVRFGANGLIWARFQGKWGIVEY